MRKKIRAAVEKSRIGNKAVHDGRYRTVLFACFSFAFNLLYAAYNAFLGIRYSSLWYTVLFAYYSVLSLMRFYAVTFELKENTQRTEARVMRFCGGWLCFLAFILAVMVYLSVTAGHDAMKSGTLMIAIAAYTFWKAVTAVINIIRVRKKNSPLLTTLRNISCADAAASVFSLEYSMMSVFGIRPGRLSATLDIFTGTVACFAVFILGVSMAARKE